MYDSSTDTPKVSVGVATFRERDVLMAQAYGATRMNGDVAEFPSLQQAGAFIHWRDVLSTREVQ